MIRCISHIAGSCSRCWPNEFAAWDRRWTPWSTGSGPSSWTVTASTGRRVWPPGCSPARLPCRRSCAANRRSSRPFWTRRCGWNRRSGANNLAFGRGVHFCVGSALAKLEATAALTALLERTAHFELIEAAPPQWFPSIFVRRHTSLPLRVR
ncbi:cytochrome P450 [Nocardia sp. NPDC088792]|uniref:cytochrome P450 n=1 Tax=Nocardia sp. NPDC088792 TaxID=3364332 RepID=UPI0038143FC6